MPQNYVSPIIIDLNDSLSSSYIKVPMNIVSWIEPLINHLEMMLIVMSTVLVFISTIYTIYNHYI